MSGDGEGRRTVVAIACTVLLVTSIIAPFGLFGGAVAQSDGGAGNTPTPTPTTTSTDTPAPTASPSPTPTPTGQPETSTPDGTVGDSTVEDSATVANGSAILAQHEAVRLTRNISDGGREDLASHVDRAHDQFNRSLAYYRGPTRVNHSESYTHDAVGVRALANLANTDADIEDARLAADIVYEADNETAETTVEDARRVVERYEPDMDNQGLAISAERHLENAERELEGGQGVGDGEGHQYFEERGQALTRLRTAQQQAEQAMRMVDAEVDPAVSVESEADPVWNGTGTRTYTVQGTVATVRPSTIENVTVAVNGENRTVATTSLDFDAPASNSTFEAQVNLTDRVNRIEVTTIDSADDGQNQPGQQDTDVLRLDGDGLPESYETETTGTDPLDPDSNSTFTAADERDNGTIDGHEDFDGDGIETLDERELETDPHDPDTDDDGLTDREELVVQMDPLDHDSDSNATDANERDNGVEDGAEDLDGDGLSNAEEFANGSSPLYEDSDDDGLSDPEELERGTDPMDPDTDDDYLRDGEELEEPFDMDPLDPDTNDNGVLDGNETYTTTGSSEEYGVSVALEGQGNVASGLTIVNGSTPVLSSEGIEDASVAPMVNLETERPFETAEVTFQYDEENVDDGNLAVARYNRTRGTFDLLNTSSDPTAGTVTAETSHFSRFTVFNVENWNKSLSASAPDAGGDGNASRSVGVLHLLDTSGSMTNTDPQRFAKDAAQRFTGALLPEDRAAVMEFAHVGTLRQELTPDHASLNQSIRDLEYRGGRGGTRIGPSLADGNDYFIDATNDSRVSVIVFLTDGRGPGGLEEAERAAEHNITIHTIGFDSSRQSKLETIANTTGGSFHSVDSASDLPEVFSRVADNATGEVDSDGDGLPDSVERGFRTGQGDLLRTDPDVADTDGDGIVDGNETGQFVNETRTVRTPSGQTTVRLGYWNITSNPTLADSDGDGLDDSTELDGWDVPVENRSGRSNPYRFATDCHRAGDSDEELHWEGGCDPDGNVTVTSDPLAVDSDDDGLTDFEEFNETYTDPESPTTYSMTDRREETLNAIGDETRGAIQLEEIGVTDQIRQDHTVELDDGSDSFGFVMNFSAEQGIDQLRFVALDRTERTDTWLSNEDSVEWTSHNAGRLDVWDPDTDDDGLTDAQEVKHITWVHEPHISSGVIINRQDLETDPTDPDSDDDGYWDGWTGVHDVGRTDNVILYNENLQNGPGVTRNQRVDEQLETHVVGGTNSNRPGAVIGGQSVHSNLHVGEMHWGTDPTNSHDRPDPSLDIEVDWLEGHDPSSITHPSTGQNLIEFAEENYALYGIELNFHRSDEIEESTLSSMCVERYLGHVGCQTHFSPDAMNALELNHVREEYHDNRSRLHLFVTNEYNEELPMFTPHDWFVQEGVGGVAGHTGSPAQEEMLDGDGSVQMVRRLADWMPVVPVNPIQYSGPPYGVVVFHDSTGGFNATSATFNHELGHALSIGWADDRSAAGMPHIRECYSNEHCVAVFGSSADDPTIEYVDPAGRDSWSIMSTDPRQINRSVHLPFSIEEIQTVEFDKIPTIND